MSIKRPISLYDGVHKEIQTGDVIPSSIISDDVTEGKQLLHGFEFPYQISLSYDNVTRQVTITPLVTSFDIWLSGIKTVKTGPQISPPHDNITGSYYIYYNSSGVLVSSSIPWDLLSPDYCPVCFIYYNATLVDGFAIFECHTAKRNLSWHKSQHFSIGSFVKSGFSISSYTLNTDTPDGVTFGLSSGVIVDEDIEYNIETLLDNGPYTIMRRSGVSDIVWSTSNTLPYLFGTTLIQYNQNVGGSYQLTELNSTDYVNYWVFCTTAIDEEKRILIIPGQEKFTSLTDAQAAPPTLDFGTLPLPEITLLYRLTYRCRSTWTGVSGRARLVSVTRTVLSNAQINGDFYPSVHNSLSGRSDPDTHPASSITNIPSGAITSLDVQGAITELDNRIVDIENLDSDIEAIAGDNLGGNRIVVIYNDSAVYADKDTNYTGLLGMTLGAANINDIVRVRINSIIEEPTWSLVQGFVFLDNNGLFTQTKPTTGMVILVGTAVSPTKMELKFQQLYKRV